MVLRLLGFYDIRQILELVIPGVHGDQPSGGTMNQIRYITAGYGRDDLLHLRPERNDACVDDVAARLLVVGDSGFEGGVLLPDEALHPPDGRSFGGSVGDKRSSQRSDRGKSHRPAKNRTPA